MRRATARQSSEWINWDDYFIIISFLIFQFFKGWLSQLVVKPSATSVIFPIKMKFTSKLFGKLIKLFIHLWFSRVSNEIIEKHGDIDILINNAGIVSGNSLCDIPDCKYKISYILMNVKCIIIYFSPNWTDLQSQYSCPFLDSEVIYAWYAKKTQGNWSKLVSFKYLLIHKQIYGYIQGHIVNIASLAGTTGCAKLTDYCASKFAAVGLHESLKVELDAEGNKDLINCIYIRFIWLNLQFSLAF